MPDTIDLAPDLSLIIGPEDDATFVMDCLHRNRRGIAERSLVYVVVHRRYGLWTHVYRVVPEGSPAALTVYLEKAIEGEAVNQARDWAIGKFQRG
ncbi:MAG TPA: hypothetical protein VGM59_12925 [Dongiaceae bacterium]|jgi:hypothetical protein